MRVLQNNLSGSSSLITPSFEFRQHYNKCSRSSADARVSVRGAKTNTSYVLSYKIRFLTNARNVGHFADSGVNVRSVKIDGEAKSISSMEWFDMSVREATLNTWYEIEIGFDSTVSTANIQIAPNSGIAGAVEFEVMDLKVNEGTVASDVWLPPFALLSETEQSYIPMGYYGEGWGEASAF